MNKIDSMIIAIVGIHVQAKGNQIIISYKT